MKLADLLKGVEVTELKAPPELEIADVCYDSRRAAADTLFVAVRGFEADGHRYIYAEAAKGAVCAVCEEPPECAIDLIDSARALQFRASAQFDARPVNDQLRIWSGVAQEAKGSFHLSDEGVQGSLVPVVSRYVLDAYSAVIDATVDTRDGKWILWHRSTDMIYACGWPYSAVGVLLRGIIEDKN